PNARRFRPLLRARRERHAAAPPRSVMNARRLMSDIGLSSRLGAPVGLPLAQPTPRRPAGPWGRPESFWNRALQADQEVSRSFYEILPRCGGSGVASGGKPDIEPTSAKDRVWHEADFQNSGVRGVGSGGRQSDLRKRPLDFGSLSPASPPRVA